MFIQATDRSIELDDNLRFATKVQIQQNILEKMAFVADTPEALDELMESEDVFKLFDLTDWYKIIFLQSKTNIEPSEFYMFSNEDIEQLKKKMESAFSLCRDAERVYKELLDTHKTFVKQYTEAGETSGLEIDFGSSSSYGKLMSSLYRSNNRDCFFIHEFFQMTGIEMADYKLYYEIPALYVYMKALSDVKKAIYEIKKLLDDKIYGK